MSLSFSVLPALFWEPWWDLWCLTPYLLWGYEFLLSCVMMLFLFFKKESLLFIWRVWVFYICLQSVCRGQKKVSDPLGLELEMVVNCHAPGCWKSNLSLEEKPELLTAEHLCSPYWSSVLEIALEGNGWVKRPSLWQYLTWTPLCGPGSHSSWWQCASPLLSVCAKDRKYITTATCLCFGLNSKYKQEVNWESIQFFWPHGKLELWVLNKSCSLQPSQDTATKSSDASTEPKDLPPFLLTPSSRGYMANFRLPAPFSSTVLNHSALGQLYNDEKRLSNISVWAS